MFEALFGNKSAERVLVYINTRGGGYGREIASFYDCSLTSIQKQLEKMELAGIFYGEQQGRTRIYRLNPKYGLYKQLQELLSKVVEFYPPELKEDLVMNRRRPRRTGKPLENE